MSVVINNNVVFSLNDTAVNFTIVDRPVEFTINATASDVEIRLLEDGGYRLLEDDNYRILE